VSATSITGYSGGGRSMIEQYTAGADNRLIAPRSYALSLVHKHVPEMATHSGLQVRPLFVPTVGNFYKGLAVSVPLHLSQLPGGVTPELLHDAYRQRYAGERFIHVKPLRDPLVEDAGFLDVQAANDSNRVDIFVFANADQVVLLARLDNLGKGASGAAVQSMNVHLGLDESLGLI
jgi:N-acetyl-gamma-glutamyl-phosphate reductase